ncbi:hypothetical protein [Cutibacterium granulosum]|uniref:hypothetical protein n=1 Tax=Cutibacterium granulosum TaxID=33011 RepID=UPI002B23C037|nr:hypothetical protein [Cutibacterium granulosum]MEA5640410.1 hypothetical protein [Cutibacterium granulosum]
MTATEDCSYPFFIRTQKDRDWWDDTTTSMRESMKIVARTLIEEYDATEDQLDYKSVGDALLIGV